MKNQNQTFRSGEDFVVLPEIKELFSKNLRFTLNPTMLRAFQETSPSVTNQRRRPLQYGHYWSQGADSSRLGQQISGNDHPHHLIGAFRGKNENKEPHKLIIMKR